MMDCKFLQRIALIFILSISTIEFHGQTDVDVAIVPFATGFDRPVDIVSAGDERLFVVEKEGLIKIVRPDGSVDPIPFLDIRFLTFTGGLASERGLLGLAFHPDYDTNGFFYVNYTDTLFNTRITRFRVSVDIDIADINTKSEVLFVDQPFFNHNGGCLRFGPEGYLYIGMGDGGSFEDPLGTGQDMSTMLGKMLRIDVDGGFPYVIPTSNPFAGSSSDTLPEIWASGLRNPWRFSFDRLTGDLWIGDVGQAQWEEIDFQATASSGGENYGWSCYEGNHEGFQSGCPPLEEFDGPITEYSHDEGHCSVTGGYVYRGSSYPSLYGKYLFIDYCSGQMWTIEPDGLGGWVRFEVSSTLGFGWTCFGEDATGELYLANQIEGAIYKIMPKSCSEFNSSPVDLTKSFDPVNGIQDRVQVKWYKDSPQVKYSDQDAAACDIKFWPKRNLDPETGNPIGPAIVDPDTMIIQDAKKSYGNGDPREIFKWPIKFRADGANNAKRADPNIRYEWQVRCACEHGVGPESPWSEVKIFNTPDFDPSTGIYSSSPDGNTTEYQKELGQSPLDISIYPNPFNGSEFHINSNRRIKGIMEVFDMNGRTIFSTYVDLKQSVGVFEVPRPLEQGMYLLTISSHDNHYTMRIAVQ